MKVKLTTDRVARAAIPEPKPGKTGAAAVNESLLSDTEVPGLSLRVLSTGAKSYMLRYRVGRGRGAPSRRLSLGAADQITLDQARRLARQWMGEIAAGGDPSADLRKAREVPTVAEALEAYARDLDRRIVVRRRDYMSALQRGLAKLLRFRLPEVSEAQWKGAVHAVEETGQFGAADYLRTRLTAFLGWLKERGDLEHHPLAGWRRARRTRAEQVERAGRAMSLRELALAWKSCDAVPDDFARFIRLLILTGQRRTETARMRWRDVDLEAGEWVIPAAEAKNGRAHVVPLGPMALELIRSQPRVFNVAWVFSGRTDAPISGWSKRMAKLEERAESLELARWTLHDLRRSFRSGLSELGVSPRVAEAMLNHAGSELEQVYDRADLGRSRREAALRWEVVLGAALKERKADVVRLQA